MWAAISTPIFNMLRSAGFGVTILSALTKHVVKFVGFAFVDDTDLCHAAESVNQSGESLLPIPKLIP